MQQLEKLINKAPWLLWIAIAASGIVCVNWSRMAGWVWSTFLIFGLAWFCHPKGAKWYERLLKCGALTGFAVGVGWFVAT
jgi:hypothetical protein